MWGLSDFFDFFSWPRARTLRAILTGTLAFRSASCVYGTGVKLALESRTKRPDCCRHQQAAVHHKLDQQISRTKGISGIRCSLGARHSMHALLCRRGRIYRQAIVRDAGRRRPSRANFF